MLAKNLNLSFEPYIFSEIYSTEKFKILNRYNINLPTNNFSNFKQHLKVYGLRLKQTDKDLEHILLDFPEP